MLSSRKRIYVTCVYDVTSMKSELLLVPMVANADSHEQHVANACDTGMFDDDEKVLNEPLPAPPVWQLAEAPLIGAAATNASDGRTASILFDNLLHSSCAVKGLPIRSIDHSVITYSL